MSTANTQTLLRRTTAALAAVAGFLVSGDVSALTVTLSTPGVSSCSYSAMSVAPDGNVVVTCASTAPPVGPGTFALTTSTPTLLVGTVGTFTITRTVGNTGDANMTWSASGPACSTVSGLATILASAPLPSSAMFSVTMNAAGNCGISFTGTPAGATMLGTPLNVTVSAAPPPPPPPPPPPASGCPAVALTYDGDLGASGIGQRLTMASGGIASYPLPSTTPYTSGRVIIGQTPISPGSVLIEMNISKCKGVIDPTGGTAGPGCYGKTNSNAYFEFGWVSSTNFVRTPAQAALFGQCMALPADGPWYVNTRWTYPACAYGPASCGFSIQWNPAGY